MGLRERSCGLVDECDWMKDQPTNQFFEKQKSYQMESTMPVRKWHIIQPLYFLFDEAVSFFLVCVEVVS
jgi:hypothetical protein